MQIKITRTAAASAAQRWAPTLLRLTALSAAAVICVAGGGLVLLSISEPALGSLVCLMGVCVFLIGLMVAKAGGRSEECVLRYDRTVAAWTVTRGSADGPILDRFSQARADTIELAPDHAVVRDLASRRLVRLRYAAPVLST
ncbi:hypothetical protein N6L24_09440 [Cognatishimia sp. SS12]|uniref:hypothetical protein n=1 Tax=Cognatishimia sp. SS12 TaxID=2979465 RepID=UPI00232A9AE4|nr:hypothetical protein [Cognatishimia sp. SS12]MDC0738503.1 hypothetical protein [Cognatishimia sp. SS12]